MDNHRAEVAIASARGSEAQAPFVFHVNHHRVGPADLRIERLTGGHALHLAAALCTFNNIARLAKERGIALDRATVTVDGDFTEDGHSTGMAIDATLSGQARPEDLRQLALDAAAESTVLEVLRTPTDVTVNEPKVEVALS